MNTKILNVLCEGATEELFVKRVLKEHLAVHGIVVKTRLLQTNRRLNVRGGILSYPQVRGDLHLWFRENLARKSEEHHYTTMIDLYALPYDFPAYRDAAQIRDAYLRVEKLEEALQEDVDMSGFIPYIQLHEYEALVFCGLEFLPDYYPKAVSVVKNLRKALEKFSGNPELLDGGRETSPSRRLIKELADARCHYEKTKAGVEIVLRVGLSALRERCRHFDMWVRRLEEI